MRIAHLGTFDVANFGDLLFPQLLESRLRALALQRGQSPDTLNIRHFSPRGGEPVWADTPRTYATQELADHGPFDAVIVGGGHLIHALPTRLSAYQAEGVRAETAYAELWLSAAVIAARDGARLIWNAPGVPRPLTGMCAELLRRATEQVDYLAVRDQTSADHLLSSGVTAEVHVVPDTALDVTRLWSKEELDAAYEAAFTRRSRARPSRAVVIHVSARYLNEPLESLAARIDTYCHSQQSVAILIALGPCHGDDALARRLAVAMRTRPLVLDAPQSLLEITACLARSDAYIGSSLHGLIVATAFARPAWCVARERAAGARKFSGFLAQVQAPRRLVGTWQEAFSALELDATSHGDAREARSAIERHWEKIGDVLFREQTKRRPSGVSIDWNELRHEILRAQADAANEAVGRAERLEDVVRSLRQTERLLREARDVACDRASKAERRAARLSEQLKATKKDLARRERDIAALNGWLDRLRHGMDALLQTRRWRLGNWCGDALNALLRRREPLVTELFRDIFRQHNRWRSSRSDRRADVHAVASIVVPIHNAADHVQRCLASLRLHTDRRHELILVDDASDAECCAVIDLFVAETPNARLLRNAERVGYTRSANLGWQAARGDYVVLLNSDTVVTPRWLECLLQCLRSDAALGMVGPLSNAASWQSVPELFDAHGDWAINALQDDWSIDDMACAIAAQSRRAYPRVPLLNGFCLLIRRTVWERIGFFDEAAFPDGYGEETDYCLRAANAGFALAVADDVYVHHAKSQSYGHARRQELTAAGQRALRAKHGARVIQNAVEHLRDQPVLREVRARMSKALKSAPTHIAEETRFPSVLFLLPVRGGGGGAHSVVQEAAGMRALGANACVAIEARFAEEFARQYPRWYAAGLFREYTRSAEVARFAGEFDVVVATVYFSVRLLRRIARRHPRVLPAYYVQDYEPRFFPRFSRHAREARKSYGALPGMVHFAKTAWIREQVAARHGVTVHAVTPSLDHRVFHASEHPRDGKLRIAAMIRPATPYRGAERTLRVLRAVQANDARLELHFFGASSEEQTQLRLNGSASEHWHGQLTREQVADVLRRADIFVDLSDYQAFGRTALEAMACGAAVIVPRDGGAREYAIHESNALVVDTRDEAACQRAVERLLRDESFRKRLAAQGIATAQRYTIEAAARSELELFQAELRARQNRPSQHSVSSFSPPSRSSCPSCPKKLHAILPSSGLGWPGSAYIRLLRPFSHSALSQHFTFSYSDAQQSIPTDAEAIIVQRTALPNLESAQALVSTCTARGQRLLIDLDDNLWALPADHPERKRYHHLLPALDYALEHADASIVPTETLATVLRQRTREVHVIPNALDERMWFRNQSRQAAEVDESPMRFLLMGTRTHRADLEIVAPAARRLLKEFGEWVRFDVIGCVPRGTKSDWFDTMRIPRAASEYPNFVRWLRRRNVWHVGLAPLVESEFNASKSALKYLDYSALGLAGVYSDVPAYSGVVRQLETGLLTGNHPDAWFEALRMLVLKHEFRRQLARAAYEDVRRRYTSETQAKLWRSLLAPANAGVTIE